MIAVEELIAANPFPGLRSFKPGEADRFFGREQQIEDLVARLGESPLVAVAGASGCGKSSLVLAGLLNRLQQHRAAGGSIEWWPVVLRPGNHPIASLAARLAAVVGNADDENRAASLDGRLRLGGRGLVEAVRLARLEAHVRVLVVVDQFEEIFRFKRMTDPEEATAFVKLLLHAARDPDSHVNVVLTLRSDALGHCADFRDLPETINRGQYLVPRLTREQRKEAIAKPVALRGFTIAPRLVQRILNDITDDFDDLPVMQHVLTRTWQYWATACQGARSIDIVDYEATGAAAEALSNHADEAYESLSGLPGVVERTFRALTERVAEGTERRRPLNFDQLCGVTGCDKANVEQVVERFRRPDTAFLMPSPEVSLTTNPVIDISHESLIRQWQHLRQWTQREAKSRAELLRLVEAARLYARKEGDFWRGRDLERVLEWRSNEQPTAPWISLSTGGDGASQWKLAQTFLADSKQAADRERKQRQRLVWGLCGLGLTVVVVTVVAALSAAFLQRQATARAKSGELASQALLELDPARSAHLALAAIDQDPDNTRAEYALRQSLATLEIAHAEHIVSLGEPVADAHFTMSGSRLVVASGNKISVLDTRSYKIVGQPFAREKRVTKAWLIANNTLLVSLTEDGQGQIQAVDGGPIRPISCEGDGNSIFTLAVSADEQHIAAGCFNGAITVWNVGGADAQRQPSLARGGTDKATITALSFSANNKYLASGDAEGAWTIWKLGQSAPWIGAGRKASQGSPIQHSKAINNIAFHPSDDELMATASDDGTAIVWNLDLSGRRLAPEKKGVPTTWPLKHDREVNRVQFTPRGNDVRSLMTISDKNVYFWRNEESREIRSHDDWVRDANVSDDGELLVSASSDGTARFWSTRSGSVIEVMRGHRNEVNLAFFGPKGQVVTTSLDGSLRVWRLRPPLLLASGSRWMLSAAFDPAGKGVALCGEELCSIIDPQDVSRRQSPDQQKKEKLEWVNSGQIHRVTWSADGRLLLAGRTVNLPNYKGVRPMPILWDADGRRVITPKWLEQWQMAAFSARTTELVTSKFDGAIAVWDTAALMHANPEPKYQFPPTPGRWRAAMSPDGRWIAAIEAPNRVALLDPTKPDSAPRLLEGHRGTIVSVKFSRDSRWLVTASSDRTARVWPVDQRPGQPPFVELTGGHAAALSSAAFNHDGRQVVTSGTDNTIRVWDARKGDELAVLRWHGDAINEVEFDLNGQGILSASDDGTVKLGRCEACNQTVAQLRERVRDEAVLPPDELAQLQTESRAAIPFLQLPAFFSGER